MLADEDEGEDSGEDEEDACADGKGAQGNVVLIEGLVAEGVFEVGAKVDILCAVWK
jgi:hypothetical protein